MIKLSEGELLDLLPDYYKADPDWIAFSYALKMAADKLRPYQRRTMMYAALDEQPDEILDYMAVEKRVMFYDENASLAKKRDLIRTSGAIYEKAGTLSAVQEVVDAAFGESTITEWFDLAGAEPGEFDIEVLADITLTPDTIAQFARTIENAKALTSHLRHLIIKRPVMVSRYVGVAAVHNIRSVINGTGSLDDRLLTDEMMDILTDENGIALMI